MSILFWFVSHFEILELKGRLNVSFLMSMVAATLAGADLFSRAREVPRQAPFRTSRDRCDGSAISGAANQIHLDGMGGDTECVPLRRLDLAYVSPPNRTPLRLCIAIFGMNDYIYICIDIHLGKLSETATKVPLLLRPIGWGTRQANLA